MPPPSSERRHASAADLDACAALLCSGSRSFFVAGRILPAATLRAATALYAFCRQADDAIDLAADDAARTAALAALSARLDDIFAGAPRPDPVDRALTDVVGRHDIPRALPDALLEGFVWDAQGRVYDTLQQVFDYAARVAGSVGAMMALLMGARSADALARASELGVAMQLTNIARDVGEDGRRGRLYLPREWLREEGIDCEQWLRAPHFTPALGRVVQRLLREADALYARAGLGIAQLRPACRPGIRAAALLYARIGREVERNGLDSVSRRAAVPGRIKAALLVRALGLVPHGRQGGHVPPLPAVRFLLDAVHPAGATTPRHPAHRPLRSLDAQAAWVVDLFMRLERREQLQRSRG